MDTTFDYYLLLHVQPDAPAPVIKASYRAMMQKLRHHPDLGGDPSVAQRLNEAVDILCDPGRRAVYDKQRQSVDVNHSRANRAAQATTPEPGDEPESKTKAGAGTNAEPETDVEAEKDTAAHTEKKTGNTTEQTADNKADQRAGPFRARLAAPPLCPFCKVARPSRASGQPFYPTGDVCHRCKGPATPVDEFCQADSEELRRIYRHSMASDARVWTQWPLVSPIGVTLTDLSPAGCALESTEPLDANRVLLIETEAVRAIGKVCYCKRAGDGQHVWIGLQFLTVQVNGTPGSVFAVTA